MKFTFLKIKFLLGEKFLQRLINKENIRQISSCNIEDAKSMGMICVIKNESDYQSVVKIIKMIKDEFKILNIKILAITH